MNELSPRERELVAIGAALGSNCTSCIEFHIPEARTAGLTDRQIEEAVELADAVRLVPARKALEAASTTLSAAAPNPAPEGSGKSCAGMMQAMYHCCGA